MKKKILIIGIIFLLAISGVTALVSTEYGQGIIKGDSVIYKGEVTKTTEKVPNYTGTDLTPLQFAQFDLDNYNFNLQFTDEYIIDKEGSNIYYIYTAVLGVPNYEGSELTSMGREQYEIKMAYPFEVYRQCRLGNLPDLRTSASCSPITDESCTTQTQMVDSSFESCKAYGKEVTQVIVERKLKNIKKDLLVLQQETKVKLGLTTDNNDIYNDFMNNLE